MNNLENKIWNFVSRWAEYRTWDGCTAYSAHVIKLFIEELNNLKIVQIGLSYSAGCPRMASSDWQIRVAEECTPQQAEQLQHYIDNVMEYWDAELRTIRVVRAFSHDMWCSEEERYGINKIRGIIAETGVTPEQAIDACQKYGDFWWFNNAPNPANTNYMQRLFNKSVGGAYEINTFREYLELGFQQAIKQPVYYEPKTVDLNGMPEKMRKAFGL